MSTRRTSRTVRPIRGELVLEAVGISVGYGYVPAVRSVDLEVKAGEVVALVGANGAGKTTTLRALAGLLPLGGGQVNLFGQATKAPLHRRSRAGLAYVPEERGIFRTLTTMENLRLGRGEPAAALDLMPELRPLVDRTAGLLSGGEQQMLSVARALAARPSVILCDELSLGLAPIIVHRLLQALRTAADGGVGVLLVEQQVRAALSIADQVYVLRRGVVAMSDKASAIAPNLAEIEAHYLDGLPVSETN